MTVLRQSHESDLREQAKKSFADIKVAGSGGKPYGQLP